MRFLEGELAIVLPHNGAIIKLYGGMSAYERMRGMYFDGIVLDEYPLLQKTVFSTVVRPCLADYRGWAIVSGTSNGDDHFNPLRLRAMDDERWDVFLIPLSETGEEALSYAEAKELTQDMSPDEYAREMECSFDAPVEGAYFAEALNALALQGRVCAAPVDLSRPVITAWDLGVHDYCSIWWWQIVGKEVHFVDYEMAVGKGLDHWASVIRKKALAGGYEYRCHLLPHDIEAREISSAKSRRATLSELIPHDEPIITVPRIRSKEDGIHAARAMLGSAYFDADEMQDRPRHAARLPQERDGPAGAWARPALARRRRLPDRRRRLPPRHRPLGLDAQARRRCAGRSGGSCDAGEPVMAASDAHGRGHDLEALKYRGASAALKRCARRSNPRVHADAPLGVSREARHSAAASATTSA